MNLTVAEQQRLGQLADLVEEVDSQAAPQLRFVHRALEGINRPGQSLGVLSSAFNPPTIAHVEMAALAQHHFQMDEILLELSVVNVDKSVFGADLGQRCWLLENLVKSYPSWTVGLGSHGRFVDKARAIRAVYPSQTNLYFILGF
ncbi:MAG: hypothetical protein EXR62_15025, partial [Chloroflexi bacterium]|nr:hypothetical protein [Chloroflexota bacterium]